MEDIIISYNVYNAYYILQCYDIFNKYKQVNTRTTPNNSKLSKQHLTIPNSSKYTQGNGISWENTIIRYSNILGYSKILGYYNILKILTILRYYNILTYYDILPYYNITIF